MWTNVPSDLAACLPIGSLCGLMYLMTWRLTTRRARVWTNVPSDLAACLPIGSLCGLMYLMTWPPVCQ